MLDYEKIAKHYEKCFEINGDTCKGVDWPRQSEAENRYKVMLNVIDWYKMKAGVSRECSILCQWHFCNV